MTTQAIQINDSFNKDFTAFVPEIKKLLPSYINIEKFERVVLTAVQMNEDLLKADRKTLFTACLKAASDGLLPDGREGAIVTFSTKGVLCAQWMPMVSGIIKKVRNSGELKSIVANIVHEKDVFKYAINETGESITHEPNVFADRGKAIGCYAIAETKEGAKYFDVMSEADVMATKSASKAKFGPWDGPFKFEMWKKTVIRRLSKRLPMSSEVESVIQADDELFEFDNEPKKKEITSVIHVESKPMSKAAQVVAEQNRQQAAMHEPTGALSFDDHKTTPEPTNAALTQATVESGLANPYYVVPIGKNYKGMMIKDIEADKLESFGVWLINDSFKKNKQVDGLGLEFVDNVQAFLNVDLYAKAKQEREKK